MTQKPALRTTSCSLQCTVYWWPIYRKLADIFQLLNLKR